LPSWSSPVAASTRTPAAAFARGATGSTQLRYVSFQESYHDGRLAIQSDTLAAALGPASKLTGFEVRASSWTDEAVEKAVAALRTNAELQDVQFVSFDPKYLIRHAALFEDLLHRYNFTLVDLSAPDGADQERILALLRRNEHIRALHGGLRDRGYCVPNPAALWPNVLERIGTSPRSCTGSSGAATRPRSRSRWRCDSPADQ
jgi:hypothetical protein